MNQRGPVSPSGPARPGAAGGRGPRRPARPGARRYAHTSAGARASAPPIGRWPEPPFVRLLLGPSSLSPRLRYLRAAAILAVGTFILLLVLRVFGVFPGPGRVEDPSASARPHSEAAATQAPGAPGAPGTPAGAGSTEPADSGKAPGRTEKESASPGVEKKTDGQPANLQADPEPELVSRRAPDPGPQAEPEAKQRAEPESRPEPQTKSSGPAVAGAMPGPGNLGTGEVARAPQAPKNGAMRLTIPKMERVAASPVTTSAADDTAALDAGLLHASGSGFPWEPEANVYISGHRLGYRNTASYLIFWDLNALSEGDAVVLTDSNDKDYRYRVYEVFTVAPGETDVMLPVEGKNIVSLQTCTLPDYTKRLIVRAERVA